MQVIWKQYHLDKQGAQFMRAVCFYRINHHTDTISSKETFDGTKIKSKSLDGVDRKCSTNTWSGHITYSISKMTGSPLSSADRLKA